MRAFSLPVTLASMPRRKDQSDRPANDIEPTNKRGRPTGPWQGKGWRDAVVKAAYRRAPDGQRYLDVMAQRLVANAVAGDNVALQHVGERLDGKVHSSATEGQARVSFVVHMPAPMAADQWQRMATPALEHAPQHDQGDLGRVRAKVLHDEAIRRGQDQGHEVAQYRDLASPGSEGQDQGRGQGSEVTGYPTGQDHGDGQGSEVTGYRDGRPPDAGTERGELGPHEPGGNVVRLGELGAVFGAVHPEKAK